MCVCVFKEMNFDCKQQFFRVEIQAPTHPQPATVKAKVNDKVNVFKLIPFSKLFYKSVPLANKALINAMFECFVTNYACDCKDLTPSLNLCFV